MLFSLFLRYHALQRKRKEELLMEHHASCQSETLVAKTLDLKELELDYSSLELVKFRAVSGGQAWVSFGYLGKTQVAVKEFFSIIDDGTRKKFYREAEVHKNLRHPNVVLLLGYCRQPPCMVLEFMQRGSLYEVLRSEEQRKHLDTFRVLQLATDIALGMEYLHGKSIVHRDLKSLNVLLDLNWTAKIADFGLSRVFDKQQPNLTIMPGGSIAWMAPEVLSGNAYTEKADVYSYAIILWELATKSSNLYPQFQFNHQIADYVVEGNRPPIPEECPPLLQNLMTSCWVGQPELRPTFHEVLKKIQQSFKIDKITQENENMFEEDAVVTKEEEENIELTPLLSSSIRVLSNSTRNV
jgi:serine/threonine protein kinase